MICNKNSQKTVIDYEFPSLRNHACELFPTISIQPVNVCCSHKLLVEAQSCPEVSIGKYDFLKVLSK